MRPILKLLPAFIWLWIVKRHAQQSTIHSSVIVRDVGGGIGVIFPTNKEATR